MPSQSLPRASRILQRGTWAGPAADHVLLDFDDRHRRRLHMSGVEGLQFLLDLPKAQHLRSGDALELEDGRLIAIQAQREQLIEATAPDCEQMARLAWHIGNRHLPMEITQTALRIRADSIIEAMLMGLGATLQPIDAPFEPENSASGAQGSAHSSEDNLAP